MELLAPAGNWDAFIAAMNNGADAVYLGGKSYSARQSAENFDLEQIEAAADYAHLRDKKVYVTVNTIIDNSEIGGVLDYLYELQKRSVDAVIVQDIGLVEACRQILPQLRLHASTQMTVHNADGAAFLKEQGLERIVLARELSYADINAIHNQQKDTELEVFVHGALCFCYSGQCLFSSMVGGRSGNRGRCAQPCRMAYQLNCNSSRVNIDTSRHGKYLLSPADLCLIEYLPELKDSGVVSLKIEGRMKRPEYVAVVSRAYREALDLMEASGQRPTGEVKEKLLKIFNRRFSTGYFLGNKDLLSTRRPNNRGVFVGRITEQTSDLMTGIKLSDKVHAGDGLVIWVGKGKNPAIVIKEMFINNRPVLDAQAGDVIKIKLNDRVFAGDRVFKTHDEELLSEAQQSIQDEISHKINVDAEVILTPGQPLRLILTDDHGNRAEAATENAAQEAVKHALNKEVLQDKLGRMGNTDFILRNLTLKGAGNLMLPFSDLNEVRRQAIDQLTDKRLLDHQAPVIDPQQYARAKKKVLNSTADNRKNTLPLLTVAVSNIEHARLALENGADQILLGLEGMGTRKRPSKSQLQEIYDWSNKTAARVIPVLPKISLPRDTFSYRDLAQTCPTIMVGNWGDLKWGLEHGKKLLADYSFNVFNNYSLEFLNSLGLETICLTPELNFKQLHSFNNFAKVELIVQGKLLLMESQCCTLRATLGGDGEKCQAPCGQGSYELQDEKGFKFPVATDADCRFHVFNSRSLCLIEDLPRIIDLGPKSIRIEARFSRNQNLAKTVNLYRLAIDRLAAGQPADLSGFMEELTAMDGSFTKGHYYRGVL